MRITALLFILLPLVEITGFILVGKAVGVAVTLGLIILSAVAGLILLRVQGVGMVRKLRRESQSAPDGGEALAHEAMIAAAAILLIVPGFVTDIIGLLLLLPFLRDIVWSRLGARTVFFSSRQRFYAEPGNGSERAQPRTIELHEADFRREPDNRSPWHVEKDGDR